MPEPLSLLSAFVIGLAGGLHCVVMCGGISGALGFATGRNYFTGVLAYNFGRITSYAFIGFIIGYTGWLIGTHSPWAHATLKIISGLLLILIGLRVSGVAKRFHFLEKGGAAIWQHISPLATSLFPIDSVTKAWLFGMVWGWLPCGLVYSALAWSVSNASSASNTAILMGCFGLGTLPWLMVTSIAGNNLARFTKAPAIKIIFTIALVSLGVISIAFTLMELSPTPDGAHSMHHAH